MDKSIEEKYNQMCDEMHKELEEKINTSFKPLLDPILNKYNDLFPDLNPNLIRVALSSNMVILLSLAIGMFIASVPENIQEQLKGVSDNRIKDGSEMIKGDIENIPTSTNQSEINLLKTLINISEIIKKKGN